MNSEPIDFENATIVVSYPPPRSITTIIASYMRAVERFRNAYELSTSNNELQVHYREIGYTSLMESVAWARTLIDGLDEGKSKFPNQELAFAFKFARNQVLHTWDELIDISLRRNHPTKWIWSSKNQDKYVKEKCYSEYKKALMGREIIETLDEFSVLIWSLRKWEIKRSDLFQPGIEIKTPIKMDE